MKNIKGFTLIELLVVVLIIGRAIRNAQEGYYMLKGTYTTDLTTLPRNATAKAILSLTRSMWKRILALAITRISNAAPPSY
jgi:type II secretory pathway pseudopilin PulG